MKAIVIEDSRLARQGLVNMLKDYREIQVLGSAQNVDEGLKLIANSRPDLLFLDIHMPGKSGFDLLEQLDYQPKVIFTTAFSDYAIRSFDYNTVDYLLKPIRKERLLEAIQKLNVEPVDDEDDEGPTEILEGDSRILIRDGDKCHLVEVRAIDYVESCKNYVRVFFDGSNAFVKKSLNQTEKRLPKKLFFRANRQCIVNIQAIRKIDLSVNDGYELTMSDGRMVEVSRRSSSELKALLKL